MGRHDAGKTDNSGKRGTSLTGPDATAGYGKHRPETLPGGGETVEKINDRLWDELEDEHGRPDQEHRT